MDAGEPLEQTFTCEGCGKEYPQDTKYRCCTKCGGDIKGGITETVKMSRRKKRDWISGVHADFLVLPVFSTKVALE